MRPIPYGRARRWSDWYHGWRDGRADIPALPSRDEPPRTAHTPHRETLIRAAQDAFERERLVYEDARADALGRATAARAALRDGLPAELEAAMKWLVDASRPLSEAERTRRRHGEERHDERVIVERRLREQRRRVEAARAAVARVQARVTAAERELAAAVREIEQHREAASARVRRIHEYTHLRMATYLRRLVRSHTEGARVNDALGAAHPEIPGWVVLDEFAAEAAQPDPGEPPEPDSAPVPEASPDRPPRVIPLPDGTTVFGSDAEEPYRLDALVAAPRHFSLTREAGGLRLRVRGHGHGPYYDGEQVASRLLMPDDHFDFGGRRYTVTADGNLEDAPLGGCALVVDDLFALAKDGSKNLLTGMSFVQRENTLLAVLGPSGAGKSSLFAALLGELATEPGGRLFFRDTDVVAHPARIRDELGFVPQDVDLHDTLTVRNLLRYGFRMRSPARRQRREERIADVCDELGLAGQLDQLVSTLSGGQRRRASIALELLTEPRLLMLDEPTSGLDPAMDREVMTILRDYAAKGRTVIVVTHATEHLGWAQQLLVVASQGRPVFSGPPRQARRRLRFGSYAELMKNLVDDPDRYARRYASGGAAREARREADKLAAAGAGGTARTGSADRGGRVRQTPALVFLRQLRVLIRRQCALVMTRGLTGNQRRFRDVVKAAAAALSPLLITAVAAGIAVLVTEAPGLGVPPPDAAEAADAGPVALSLLTTLCVLSGQALTYSDLVSEFSIIRREHRTGTPALAVTLSKWLVFAVIAVAQAAIIGTVFWACGLGPERGLVLGPAPGLIVALAALSVAAMTLGLLISALSRRLEQAVLITTGVSIVQIAFNGVTADLSQDWWLNALAWPLPDRWGLAAAASSIGLRDISTSPVPINDALWVHSTGQWLKDLGTLGGLTAVFFVLATWVLHRRLNPARVRRRKGVNSTRAPGLDHTPDPDE